MERDRLKEILDNIPRLRIAVVGDFFLDKWLEIDRSLDEISVETNLVAYQVVAKRCYAGAAGTVLSNLSALEAGELFAIGFLGDDGEAFEMIRILKKLSVNTEALFKSGQLMTPVYTKPVFTGKNGLEETHRLDHRNLRPAPKDLEQKIIDAIWSAAPGVDAIIASDQLTHEGCGVLTPRVRQELSKLAAQYPALVLYADSRAFIKHFQNTIIKCNHIEALKLFCSCDVTERAKDMAEVEKAFLNLSKLSGKPVFITCGSKGVMVQDEKGLPFLVPAVSLPSHIKIDIVGAGDACTSGIVTALCLGASPQEAACVGNLVAANTIQVIGTTGTTTREEVMASYDKYCCQ